MLNLDLNTEFGAHVAHRLQTDEVIWLTTISPSQTPQPAPVWFWWDGASFLVYTRPGAHKLRNLARNPKVALNFNSDMQGSDIIVFTGQARIETDAPPPSQAQAYIQKYRQGIQRIQMTPESFAQAYTIAIRITPTGLRGH